MLLRLFVVKSGTFCFCWCKRDVVVVGLIVVVWFRVCIFGRLARSVIGGLVFFFESTWRLLFEETELRGWFFWKYFVVI